MKQNLNHLSLKQLLAIKENQYRSKDNSVDYCPFTVEERIIEIKMRQAESMLKIAQVKKVIVLDEQLGAQMQVTMPGKYLLALIDYALKLHKAATKTVEVTVYENDQECVYQVEVIFDGVDFIYSDGALLWPDRDTPDYSWEPPEWVLDECEREYQKMI